MAAWEDWGYYDKACGANLYSVRYSTADLLHNGPPTYLLDNSFMCKLDNEGSFRIGEYTESRTPAAIRFTPSLNNSLQLTYKEFCLFGQFIVSGLAKEMVERASIASTVSSMERFSSCIHAPVGVHKIGKNGLYAYITSRSAAGGYLILRRRTLDRAWGSQRAALSSKRVDSLYALFTNYNKPKDLLNVLPVSSVSSYRNVFNDFLMATRMAVGVTLAAEAFGKSPKTNMLGAYGKEELKPYAGVGLRANYFRHIKPLISSAVGSNIVLAHMLGNERLHEGLVTMDMVVEIAKAPDLILEHRYTHAIIRRLGELIGNEFCPSPRLRRMTDLEVEPYIRDGDIFQEFGSMCTSGYNINKVHNKCCVLRPKELALRYVLEMDDEAILERMDVD